MKAASLVTAAGLLGLLAAGSFAVKQHGAAQVLQREAVELTAALEAASPPSVPVAEPNSATPAVAPLSDAERLELLRLRGQIGKLRSEARGLEAAQQENVSLRQRRDAAKANPGSIQGALPPGYILRRTARNIGQGTPEATLETFLWAVEHRDTNVLLSALTPELAEKLGVEMARQAESFWEGAGKLPGMRMRDKQVLADGSVEVKLGVELEGNADEHTTKMRLVDGRWRLELH